jgi:hypothetical protein
MRKILDGSSAAPLGSVCDRVRVRPFWLRWLLGPNRVLEVHEIEDNSLLFTMQFGRAVFGERPWDTLRPYRVGRQACWSVNDADGRPVGELAVASGMAAPAPALAPARNVPLEAGGLGPAPTLVVQAVDLQGRTVELQSDWLDQRAETPLMAQRVVSDSPAFRCASVWREQQETFLKFDEQIEGEPFLRMLILGAVLIATD